MTPNSKRSNKVWGGTSYGKGRMIVRAATRKAAILLLAAARYPMSLYYFSVYWGETGNKRELEVAFEDGVWFTTESLRDDAEWTRLV